MRLTHIKLAGFKSFVDPTSFAVPSQLVGVVGPNGCGKSNIIDAVRWVLGESKASELRGESMQDVIFNGSTSRKPASRASVELIFDNSEGRAGGHWKPLTEIAVKRVLTRDGTSTYYINQQPVRRRDVQDIFLGTGLGPRAYAIIGQGMIARLIEAKPEEIRVFLEEAAGVSKYKERRRETENRLGDTRDNLTRVEDILRELDNTIEKLQQQAEIAAQYRRLDTERAQKQHWLWLIRLNEAQEEQGGCARVIGQANVQLEALNAQSVQAQTELFILRDQQPDVQHQVDDHQQRQMALNAQVSLLEADLRVMAAARQRLAQRMLELNTQRSQWQARLSEALQTVDTLKEDLQSAQDMSSQARYSLEEASLACDPAREALEKVRAQWQNARDDKVRIEQHIKAILMRREMADKALLNMQTRQQRLLLEQRAMVLPKAVDIEEAWQETHHLQTESEALDTQKLQLQAQIRQAQDSLEVDSQTARTEQQTLTAVTARLDALRQLHERLQHNNQLTPWLKKVGLNKQPQILQKIRVESGWEKALEALLRERLSAFEVDHLDTVASFVVTPPTGAVSFVAPVVNRAVSPVMVAASGPAGSVAMHPDDLAARIQCTDLALKHSIIQWLRGVKTMADLPTAIAQRTCLSIDECFVTPEGHVVTSDSVNFYAQKDESSGALVRLQDMENLEREVQALLLLANKSEAQRVASHIHSRQMEGQYKTLESRFTQVTRQWHDAQIHVLKLSEAASRTQQKLDQINLELNLLADDMTEQHATLTMADEDFVVADEQLACATQQCEQHQDQLVKLERHLKDLEIAVRERERQQQEADFAIRTLETRLLTLKKDIVFAQNHISQLDRSLVETTQEASDQDENPVRQALQRVLQDRVSMESALANARDRWEGLLAQMRVVEENERAAERLAVPLRDKIQALGLKEQAARLTFEQYDGQLTEAQVDRIQLALTLQDVIPVPKPAVLQADVMRLSNAVLALGPVNLAALDELTACTERRRFLDQQSGDLQEAMATLEDAIRRIDKETRILLQETFDTVNGHFGRLFPQLFGGGEARLVMAGDEILDAGVQVFAQPPGKKNGTIHLLSGGEKALTATALVFAIFELNPAPFCLLDEVDAPLDDANTERFCRLVKKMSEQTQFLFISHNKIAMEMAKQLIGVTMQEKGVSRIVAVDLASAEKLATETV